MTKLKSAVYQRVMGERNQGPETRTRLYKRLEAELGRPVVSFATSLSYPVQIEQSDADMLEETLRHLDLSKGLVLMLSTPGGDGLTAERIIQICRSYSGTNEFWALVAGRAKSAGTMVCCGASKILMGPTAELGPIDPQMLLGRKFISVYSVLASYDDLLARAIATKGNLEPFLQQLTHYDPREIEELRAVRDLAEDIAVKALCSGMLQGTNEDKVREQMQVFCSPKTKKAHGRAIHRDEARTSGLAIESFEADTTLGELAYELQMRISMLVSHEASKCIESKASFLYTQPEVTR